MSSPVRQRLGWGERGDAALLATSDRALMARALMYLLAAAGTAIVASIAIPGGPLEDQAALPVLAGISYAAALGVFFGFDKLPNWGYHVLLLGVTALIGWAIYKSGESGSPYKVFLTFVVLYAAFFMTPWATGFQIAAMAAVYGAVLIKLGDSATDPTLHWVLTTSALILVGAAVQGLKANVNRLLERLTEIGRADSVTGLYNAAAFTEMLDNEVERARRSGNRLGLIIAEVDDISPVATGPLPASHNRMLAAIGQLFRTAPRQIDMAARLGGARFALLLPYTDEHGAYLLAERLRAGVGELEPVAGKPIAMSFGVAGFPRQGANGHAIFQAAETALEEAKASGGARVMLLQRSISSADVQIEPHEELLG